MERKKRNYWTKELCSEAALNYKKRSDFKKEQGGAYRFAQKNGLIDEVCSHMKYSGNRFMRLVYTYKFEDGSVYVGLTYNMDERDIEHRSKRKSAVFNHLKNNPGIKYELTYSEFMDSDKAAKLEGETVEELKSKGCKVLNTGKTGILGGGHLKWSFEKCNEEAKKYKTRKEFATNSNSAYNSSRKNNWLDIICSHMNTKKSFPKNYWTKEKAFKESKKYSSKKDLCKKSPGAYAALVKNGWLNEACPHMKSKKPNGYWTKERCIEEMLKFKTLKEFRENSNSVYSKCVKEGWLKYVFKNKL